MTISRWLAIGLCLGFATSPAAAQKGDVVHFYTSTSESLAIGVFAKEYDKRGGTWVDDPAVGPQAEQALALNRIAGGSPPTAMQWQVGPMAEGPSHQLSHFSLSFTPDVLGQIYDLLGQYWAHPEMSADAARKQFASIIGGNQ